MRLHAQDDSVPPTLALVALVAELLGQVRACCEGTVGDLCVMCGRAIVVSQLYEKRAPDGVRASLFIAAVRAASAGCVESEGARWSHVSPLAATTRHRFVPAPTESADTAPIVLPPTPGGSARRTNRVTAAPGARSAAVVGAISLACARARVSRSR
jgi:hypothetical protein